MAHLWVPLVAGGHGVLSLEKPVSELPALPHPFKRGTSSPATLVRLESGDSWALVVARGDQVRVNGITVASGLAVLADRDEIRVAGSPPFWFSTETIAHVCDAPYLDGRVLHCPRCHDAIEAGSPAVSCPSCRVWHHQSTARPCFTYQDAPCAACGESFELDGGFRWDPEDL